MRLHMSNTVRRLYIMRWHAKPGSPSKQKGIGSTARDIVLFSVAFHRSKYRLMDALARLCQCKLKYMEQQQYKRNVITSPDHNVEDVYDNMDEEKQLLDNGMEEKHHPLHPQHH
eukprot:449695_1